nr:hypothetical protein [Tanacetum cinerariifolium]
MESQSETTQTVSALKLPVLKTREYELWSMRMEKYLTFTNHALWEVIVNGDSVTAVASANAEGPIPPKTAKQNLARKNELKAKSTLMLAILDEHPLKFHAWKDAKSLWEAIKNSSNETFNTTHNVFVASSKNQASTASYADDAEEELVNFALMAHTSSSDSKVHTCSKECLKSYNALQKQYDQQRKTLNKSNLEIIGYQIGLESLEARIVFHEKNEAVYEEDIAFLKYDVQVKDISIKEIKNQLENDLNEKDDLKLKLEKFETSFKNLTKLIDSQISATNKTGLGYDGHVNESKVLNNVVDSCESDRDNNQVNDRFKKSEGYHAVPSPYTGNYMPPRADLSFAILDDFVFKSKVSETITSVSKIETNASKTSKDSLEKPKIVRSSAPIIEDWESDSEDENMFESKEVKKTVKPSLEKIEFVNARNITVENENKAKKPRKFSQSPRVLTKSGKVPVNTAKQSSQRAAASVSIARHVNTAASRPNVNSALPKKYSYFKAHSPVRRPFNQKSAAKTNNFNDKVNNAKVNNVTTIGPKAVVSATEENRNNVVKSSACWIWRPKENAIDYVSKDNGSYTLKRFNYGNPQYALQDQGIFDSGYSRHMTGNKSYLTDYQEIDGGFIAFGGNAKGDKITIKVKLGLEI